MKLYLAIITTLVFAGLAIFSRPVLAAFDPVEDACAGNTTSSVCTTNQTENPISGKNGVLTRVVNVVSLFVGIAAVFAIVISGFRFITSQGDPAALSSAKNTILYACVGLVVIAVAQSLVVFVINKL